MQIEIERQNKRFGHKIHYFQSCTSTSDIALDLARQGASDGTLVIADEMTHGRGRQGRSWVSTEGGLVFSLIIRPPIRVEHAPRLTLMTASTLLQAIADLGVTTYVKWPNDILIPSLENKSDALFGAFKKVAGILVEISSTSQELEAAVIGIGLNLHRPINDQSFREKVPHAGFLSDAGLVHGKKEVLIKLLDTLELHFSDLRSNAFFATCLQRLKDHSAMLGKQISFSDGEHRITAEAIDINSDGSLKVKTTEGLVQSIYAGDVWLS